MAEPRVSSRRFLPHDPRVEEPWRFTPKIALRVAILGVVALGVFGVLFLRLWALQVLSGSQYLKTAENNQLRTVRLQAQRGVILDRNGQPLVTNVAGTAVQIWPADLPKKWPAQRAELRALAKVVGVPLAQILAGIKRRAGDPVTPVTVKVAVHNDQVSFLSERASEFPGVEIVSTFLRHYPYGALAAQVLGYTGEISPGQLTQLFKVGYRAGDIIGQSGVEASYDAFLRGTPGIARLRVDSLGRPRSGLQPTTLAQPGHSLRLTIDLGLQHAAEAALRYGIQLAHANKEYYASGGAIVALDPRDGGILAMASSPTYQPSVYVGKIDPQKLKPLLDPAAAQQANYPALNRVIAGQYPPGSTFKPVTALAAMQAQILSPYTSIPCTGTYSSPQDRSHQVFHNWDPNVSAQMTLPTALAASCDTYFYELGNRFYNLPPDAGHPLQQWASRFGFGQDPRLDIGPAASGLLPTPEWRKATYTKKTDPAQWQIDRLWKPGDSIQLAIGQKDLLVTPLQMARFYALVANGGQLVTPHVMLDVEDPGANGAASRVLRPYTQGIVQPSGVDPGALSVVKQGLYEATHSSVGTSTAIFGSFPVPIAGKTGTAEKVVLLPGFPRGLLLSQSWWCGYGPADSPTIVVCALIENGGHGGTAAAPAALKVFEQYFHRKAGALGPVKSD
ncbi:MAG TPA: penicillin-binding protein 2 [Gaiellaceae bacterium]|nr:penicillin-binding protein 2 [Gaiellaceae bacterium]